MIPNLATEPRCLQMFCDLAIELNEPKAVAWLTPPAPGGDPEAHLREWFERVRTFLLELPVEMRELLGGESDFDQIREEAAQVRTLRAALPEAAWPEVEQEFREIASSERRHLGAAYGRAVAFFQRELDGCEGLPYATIRARVTKELAVVAEEGIEKPGSAEATVTVAHNYLEERTGRATLIYVPSGTGEDYGTVAVPLTLETGPTPSALDPAGLEVQGNGTGRMVQGLARAGTRKRRCRVGPDRRVAQAPGRQALALLYSGAPPDSATKGHPSTGRGRH